MSDPAVDFIKSVCLSTVDDSISRGVVSYWRSSLRHPFHKCKRIFDEQFEVFW